MRHYRRGVSFALTIVVVGTVLILGGIMLTGIGGEGLSQFQYSTSGHQVERDVRQACLQLGNVINQQYCNQYVKNCRNPQSQATDSAAQTAADQGCNWYQYAQEGGNIAILTDGKPLVVTSAGTFNCRTQGHIQPTCPITPTIDGTPATPSDSGDGGDSRGGDVDSIDLDEGEREDGGDQSGQSSETGQEDEFESVGPDGIGDDSGGFQSVDDPSAEELLPGNVEHNFPDKIKDEDVYRFRVKTDMEVDRIIMTLDGEEHEMKDDGNNVDYEADDGTYGNLENIERLVGNYTAEVFFVQDGERTKRVSKEIRFKRTPPRPELQPVFREDELRVPATHTYPKSPEMEVRVHIVNDGRRAQLSAAQNAAGGEMESNGDGGVQENLSENVSCTEEACETAFAVEAQDRDTANIRARLAYSNLTGPWAKDTEIYTASPEIYDAAYRSKTGGAKMQGRPWIAEVGISKAGFAAEDIVGVSLVRGVRELGEVDREAAVGAFTGGIDKGDVDALNQSEGTSDRELQSYEGSPSPAVCDDCTPKDPDGDGLYEDINGDGTVDDAAFLANSTVVGNIRENGDAKFYDFDRNALSGDTVPIGRAWVPPVVGGGPVSIKVFLQDGTELTAPLLDLSQEEDTEPPELNDYWHQHWDVAEEGKLHLYTNLTDNLDDEVTCTANLIGVGRRDCSVEMEEPGASAVAEVTFDQPDSMEASYIEFTLSDSSGNEKTVESTKFSFDLSAVVEPYVVRGSPETKINYLVYGYDMDPEETKRILDRNRDEYFQERVPFACEYRNRINWYIVKADGVCDPEQGIGVNDDACENFLRNIKSLRHQEPVNGNKAAVIILSKADLASAPYSTTTHVVVGEQEEDSAQFTHEFSHNLWGFADEYPPTPGTDHPYDTLDSYWFTDLRNEDFEPHKYPHTWRDGNMCLDNVSVYYSDELSLSACQLIQADSPENNGYIINPKDGTPMLNGETNWYANHKAQVHHLMQNNPKYTGEGRVSCPG